MLSDHVPPALKIRAQAPHLHHRQRRRRKARRPAAEQDDMKRKQHCTGDDEQVAWPEPRRSPGHHPDPDHRADHRDDRPALQRHAEDAVDQRREQDEQARDQAGVPGADEAEAQCLRQVACRQHRTRQKPDQELPARGQPPDQGSHNEERENESQL